MPQAAIQPTSTYRERVPALYGPSYASDYPGLYLTAWPAKHALNLEVLDGLLAQLGPDPRWIDIACGQGWHFSQFHGRARMTGLDLSQAQLAHARAATPDADFICGDMAETQFAPASFDLLTNFWGGYCYLADREAIAALWRRVLGWIAPGGALYVELLLAEDLASFNRSGFAAKTGFSVNSRGSDFIEWAYEDSAGMHIMTSPPLSETLDIFRPAFRSVDVHQDGRFMTHVVAQGRLEDSIIV